MEDADPVISGDDLNFIISGFKVWCNIKLVVLIVFGPASAGPVIYPPLVYEQPVEAVSGNPDNCFSNFPESEPFFCYDSLVV